MSALTDNWKHGAASRHTIAPISHTIDLHPVVVATTHFPLRAGGCMSWPEHTVDRVWVEPETSRLRVRSPILSTTIRHCTCWLRCNIETSCHKHFVVRLPPSTIKLRHLLGPPAISQLVTSVWRRRHRRVDNVPVAALTGWQHAMKPDIYWLRIAISAYPTSIRRPRWGGVPSEYCHVWCRKTRIMVWLPDEKKWRYVYSFR